VEFQAFNWCAHIGGKLIASTLLIPKPKGHCQVPTTDQLDLSATDWAESTERPNQALELAQGQPGYLKFHSNRRLKQLLHQSLRRELHLSYL